ncbi:MAG: hypothetical protein R3F59_26210 [Myxococcota bacterium]
MTRSVPLPPPALVAVGWVATALVATAVLGVSGAMPGRWPEQAHLVGHLGLCGVLAALVAASVPGPAVRRAAVGLAATVAFGAAIEAIQLRYHPHWTEVVYDLLTDGIGACAGLLAWAHLGGRGRREAVGHLLSAALHPLWVAPVGLAMATYAGERSGGVAVRWMGVAGLCLAPAIGLWGLGVARRWWSDADLSRRTDRAGLFAVGCASLVAFGGIAAARGPDAVGVLAALAVSGAVLGTLLTVGGLKVSGHVAIPAALGLATALWSWRGPWLLLAVAVLLTWARPAAGRHQRREVAAAWALAAALGLAAALAAG